MHPPMPLRSAKKFDFTDFMRYSTLLPENAPSTKLEKEIQDTLKHAYQVIVAKASTSVESMEATLKKLRELHEHIQTIVKLEQPSWFREKMAGYETQLFSWSNRLEDYITRAALQQENDRMQKIYDSFLAFRHAYTFTLAEMRASHDSAFTFEDRIRQLHTTAQQLLREVATANRKTWMFLDTDLDQIMEDLDLAAGHLKQFMSYFNMERLAKKETEEAERKEKEFMEQKAREYAAIEQGAVEDEVDVPKITNQFDPDVTELHQALEDNPTKEVKEMAKENLIAREIEDPTPIHPASASGTPQHGAGRSGTSRRR